MAEINNYQWKRENKGSCGNYYLGIWGELIKEFNLKLQLIFVPFKRNKTNTLNRMEYLDWSSEIFFLKGMVPLCCSEDFERIQWSASCGMDKMWFLSRKSDLNITTEIVKHLTMSCNRCQSIDVCYKVYTRKENVNKESCWHDSLLTDAIADNEWLWTWKSNSTSPPTVINNHRFDPTHLLLWNIVTCGWTGWCMSGSLCHTSYTCELSVCCLCCSILFCCIVQFLLSWH